MKKVILSALIAGSVFAAVNTAPCYGCHGAHFEKKALGVSKVVKDMTSKEIAKALIGYKEGIGGPMKGVMKGQIQQYSDKDLIAFSKVIGKDSNTTKDVNVSK